MGKVLNWSGSVGCIGMVCILGYGGYWWEQGQWIQREIGASSLLESETRYIDELESMMIVVNGNVGRPLPDVSLRPTKSPNGCYTVFTRTVLYNHHSYLREESSGAITPLVSIQEPDPWSGAAHGYRWSKDSNAVFFEGQANVHGAPEVSLPLVYLVNLDKFIPGS